MGQRKLTAEERGLVCTAFNAISELHYQMMPELYSRLSGMRVHGTTDGKPYVEPQPEIGDGYRVATYPDSGRKDREYWNGDAMRWCEAALGIHAGNYTYRVPVDRIPTDDDAKQRPLVMVRDVVGGPFFKATLLAVVEHKFPFAVAFPSGAVDSHRFCRFPYPGE